MHCMLLVVINCQLFRETLSALMALNAFSTGGTGKLQNIFKNQKTKISQIESIKSSFSFKYYCSRCIKDKIHNKSNQIFHYIILKPQDNSKILIGEFIKIRKCLLRLLDISICKTIFWTECLNKNQKTDPRGGNFN